MEQGFSIPGTVSSEFGKKELHSWRSGFYARLLAHAKRAAVTVAAASPATAVEAATQGTNGTPEEGGGVAREEAESAAKVEIEDGYPKVVAFAGKRQVCLPLFGCGKLPLRPARVAAADITKKHGMPASVHTQRTPIYVPYTKT